MRTIRTYQFTLADFATDFDNTNTTGQSQFYKDIKLPAGNIVQIDLLIFPQILNDGAPATNDVYSFKYFGAVANSLNGVLLEADLDIFNEGQNKTTFYCGGYLYFWIFLFFAKGSNTAVLTLNAATKVYLKLTFED